MCIARQRGPLGPETVIWPCLTSSDHEIYHILIMHDALVYLNLSHIDFLDDPAAIHGSRLIISCTTQDASPNELSNPEILMKNHHRNIHSFALILPAIFPDTTISSCACIVLLSEASSSSHVIFNIARQRRPLASETSILPCLTASDHEICHYIKSTNLGPPKSFSYGFYG